MRHTFILLALLTSLAAWSGEAEARLDEAKKLGVKQLRGKVTFTLDDGEAYHKDAPKTFKIPDLRSRQNLKSGTFVKLMFRLTDGTNTQVERMWVIVKNSNANIYTGVLDNDPYCTDTIKSGVEVQFEPKHIIDIWNDDPEEPKPDKK